MSKKNKKGGWQDPGQGSFGDNPFASALGGLSAPQAPEEILDALAPAEEGEAQHEARSPRRAHLRVERKGRGGKMVTVVERLGLKAEALERWCSELKNELGTGGAVEGQELVFQGDQRQRLVDLLETRGVERVTGGP